ncbi:hypothetical protein Tco_0541378 [Tanacetum coccineum]
MTFGVQKHGGSNQVGFKQLGSKLVRLKQLGHKQVGFKKLGPSGVHGVHIDKRVWFESEDKQLDEKINTDRLVKEQEKVHIGTKVRANIMVTRVRGQEGGPQIEVPARGKDVEYCLSVTPNVEIVFVIMVEGDKPPKDKGVASGSNGGDIDQFDPLYLHSNDINGIPLIGFKLEGTENVTPPNGAWTEYTCPGA